MIVRETKKIILASASPRRFQLLQAVGINPKVIRVDCHEYDASEAPFERLALLNAMLKYEVARRKRKGIFLTADTIVGIDGRVLGKPKSVEEALNMLQTLSGRQHQVRTAYVIGDEKEPMSVKQVITQVTFHKLSNHAIAEYIATGSPFDKAGGYGVQDVGGQFIKQMEGSVSNVMGLPIVDVICDLVGNQLACFACPN